MYYIKANKVRKADRFNSEDITFETFLSNVNDRDSGTIQGFSNNGRTKTWKRISSAQKKLAAMTEYAKEHGYFNLQIVEA